MYNHFQLAGKYLKYFIGASNGKGHGVHSPFVFDFISNVLNDKKKYTCYAEIESFRKKLLKDRSFIEVADFGAGSTVIKTKKRQICRMAATSLKPVKYAQLIFRIVQFYKPTTVLELGTSFGITTAYLSTGNSNAHIYTLEGAPAVAEKARRFFKNPGYENIQLIEGRFDETFPLLLSKLEVVDFSFIDGNHTKSATLAYFQMLLIHAKADSIFVFDDIHWSVGMEEAWEEIKAHPSVTLSMDLFFIGLVFINPDFKVSQHFKIRF